MISVELDKYFLAVIVPSFVLISPLAFKLPLTIDEPFKLIFCAVKLISLVELSLEAVKFNLEAPLVDCEFNCTFVSLPVVFTTYVDVPLEDFTSTSFVTPLEADVSSTRFATAPFTLSVKFDTPFVDTRDTEALTSPLDNTVFLSVTKSDSIVVVNPFVFNETEFLPDVAVN